MHRSIAKRLVDSPAVAPPTQRVVDGREAHDIDGCELVDRGLPTGTVTLRLPSDQFGKCEGTAPAASPTAITMNKQSTYSPSMGVIKRRTRTSLIRRPMVVSTVNRSPSIDT